MGSAKQKLFYIDGKPVWLNEEEQAAMFPRAQSRSPGCAAGYGEGKPGSSLSMGCHPAQAGLMNDAMKAHGISGIEWDKRGKCTITSRRARARAMPVLGRMLKLGSLHDEDGGYGDG